MEEKTVLNAAEVAEYGEFKRLKREEEIALTLNKILEDLSRREMDKTALLKGCERAKKLRLRGVVVSPVNVLRARKSLGDEGGIFSPFCVRCVVGGTGESLISVKKIEAKKAIRQGAKEILLTPCYSALVGGNFAYLKREIKRIRRVARRKILMLSLSDRALGEEEIALGIRAACMAKADGVCVRGEAGVIARAVAMASGRLQVEASCVENSEQLRLAVKAGAFGAICAQSEGIAEELYSALFVPKESLDGEKDAPKTPSHARE